MMTRNDYNKLVEGLTRLKWDDTDQYYAFTGRLAVLFETCFDNFDKEKWKKAVFDTEKEIMVE